MPGWTWRRWLTLVAVVLLSNATSACVEEVGEDPADDDADGGAPPSVTLEGELDGGPVGPVVSGFYDVNHHEVGSTVDVVLSSVSDPCAAFVGMMSAKTAAWLQWQEDHDGEALAESLDAIEREFLPEEEWLVEIALYPTDDEIARPDPYVVSPLGAEADAQTSLVHRFGWASYHDAGKYGAAPEGVAATIYLGSEGTFVVESHVEGGPLEGEGSVEMALETAGPDDGTLVGTMSVTFAVEHCADYHETAQALNAADDTYAGD